MAIRFMNFKKIIKSRLLIREINLETDRLADTTVHATFFLGRVSKSNNVAVHSKEVAMS